MHKVLCCLGEVPYCFSMSSVKFEGHTGQNIDDFEPNWVFPDFNSSLTSPIALKWCHISFRGPEIEFQGRTGWKIHDLNPTWVRLLNWLHFQYCHVDVLSATAILWHAKFKGFSGKSLSLFGQWFCFSPAKPAFKWYGRTWPTCIVLDISNLKPIYFW